jgi:hypothetical protein
MRPLDFAQISQLDRRVRPSLNVGEQVSQQRPMTVPSSLAQLLSKPLHGREASLHRSCDQSHHFAGVAGISQIKDRALNGKPRRIAHRARAYSCRLTDEAPRACDVRAPSTRYQDVEGLRRIRQQVVQEARRFWPEPGELTAKQHAGPSERVP